MRILYPSPVSKLDISQELCFYCEYEREIKLEFGYEIRGNAFYVDHKCSE